jgi:leucyl-tRNA synthetase
MQRNWIGRSDGAEVKFKVSDAESTITVFTTRPDTLFGATYMVLSPEHKLVDEWSKMMGRNGLLAREEWKGGKEIAYDAIWSYRLCTAVNKVRSRSHSFRERKDRRVGLVFTPSTLSMAKKFPSGLLITYSPATAPAPSWPCRRMTRATSNSPPSLILPVVQVVQPLDSKTDWHAFVGRWYFSEFDWPGDFHHRICPLPKPKRKSLAGSNPKSLGKKTINYKLRDWLVQRQRYWGEPFPIVWKKRCQRESVSRSAAGKRFAGFAAVA